MGRMRGALVSDVTESLWASCFRRDAPRVTAHSDRRTRSVSDDASASYLSQSYLLHMTRVYVGMDAQFKYVTNAVMRAEIDQQLALAPSGQIRGLPERDQGLRIAAPQHRKGPT
jgi:hypothetical protein